MSQNAVSFESLFSAHTSPPPASPGHMSAPDHSGPRPASPVWEPESNTDSYQELERKYRHRTHQAQELIIEKVLRGNYTSQAAMEHKLHMFDLAFKTEHFLPVLICPETLDQAHADYEKAIQDSGQVNLIISSIFSELFGEHYTCYPANLDDRYAFLLNFDDINDPNVSIESIAAISRYGVKFIKDNFNLSVHICIGDIAEGFRQLQDTFREIEIVVNDSNTVYEDGVCSRGTGGVDPSGSRPAPNMEKQYLNTLITQDFDGALQLTLDRVHSMYSAETPSDLAQIKAFLSIRLQTTGNILSVPLGSFVGPDDVGLPGLNSRLDTCTTLSEIEEFLSELFCGLQAHYSIAPTEYTGVTGKVIQLIGHRYMEPDLSVERICDSLGKSRSYLSRVFKENTGVNLLDYLHTTRLKEAKRLLNTTDLGISEIASKVGYYSGWTLARVFKRYEGITPTAYRKVYANIL